jgi:pyruvate decarboxylase
LESLEVNYYPSNSQLGLTDELLRADYELALLDLVTDNDLNWKGNPNELIASYAADGYARVKGAAAFVTTFGPGELSAYCGMAGHYCEYVPVVHIVGYPTVSAVRSKAIMHHSLGNGRFDMYENMAKHIMAATTVIDNPPTAAAEIDRVLNTMMLQSRPVYIGLSVDMAYESIPASGLESLILTTLPPNVPEVENLVVERIIAVVENAKKPIIIFDGGTWCLLSRGKVSIWLIARSSRRSTPQCDR